MLDIFQAQKHSILGSGSVRRLGGPIYLDRTPAAPAAVRQTDCCYRQRFNIRVKLRRFRLWRHNYGHHVQLRPRPQRRIKQAEHDQALVGERQIAFQI